MDFYKSYFMGRKYTEKVMTSVKLSLYIMKPSISL